MNRSEKPDKQLTSAYHPRRVEVVTPAKVNLFLELLGKRNDGYHEIETVMAPVALYDRICLTSRNDDLVTLHLTWQNSIFPMPPKIPSDESNLVVQAIKQLQTAASEKFGAKAIGCDIWLHKGIPCEAGLGGGSSDAAATLVAGCRLWQLAFSLDELVAMASQLGSDIPFFLYPGTALCRGRGEQVSPLVKSPVLDVVIAKPASGLSTAAVYKNAKLPSSVHSAGKLTENVISGDRFGVGRSMFNRLQESAMSLNQDLPRLASYFQHSAACGHLLSGSGTSYYGIFSSSKVAQQTANYLTSRLPHVKFFCTRTLARGVWLDNN